jgi:hypothetical protein
MSDKCARQRRDFLKTAGTAEATVVEANFFVHAADKAGAKPAVIGSGEFTYECHHHWGEVPARAPFACRSGRWTTGRPRS